VRERTPSFAYTCRRGLDRVHAQKQLGGGLLVRPPLRHERGDPRLTRGQLRTGGPATPKPCQVAARPLRPERCAELFEHPERRLERLARRPLPPCPPLHLTEDEQRPRALKWHRQPGMLDQRAFAVRDGGFEITLRRGDQSTRAGGGRERPGTVDCPPSFLEPRAQRRGSFELTQADQRLDVIAVEAPLAGLDKTDPLADRVSAAEMAVNCRELAQREVEETEHPQVDRDYPQTVHAVAHRQPLLGVKASRVDAAEVGIDETAAVVVDCEPLLLLGPLRQLERLGRVPVGQGPVAVPKLEFAQVPEHVRQRALITLGQRVAVRGFETLPCSVEVIGVLQALAQQRRSPIAGANGRDVLEPGCALEQVNSYPAPDEVLTEGDRLQHKCLKPRIEALFHLQQGECLPRADDPAAVVLVEDEAERCMRLDS